MIIWGKRDPILGGEIPARLRSRDFKTAEYHVLSSAAHCPAETHSQAVRDFLRGWIRELWAGETD
jgi:pimeloyl-ACP methyl ester carboxylesterase